MKLLLTSSIGRKITGGYLILAAIILATALLAIYQLGYIESIISNQLLDRADARSLNKDIIIRSKQVSILVSDYCATADPARKQGIRMNIMDNVTFTKVFIRQMLEKKISREEEGLIFMLIELYDGYEKELMRVLDNSAMNDEFDYYNSRIVTLLQQIDKEETRLMVQSWIFTRERIRYIRLILVSFLVAAVVAGLFMGFRRTRSIVVPIKNLAAVLDEYGRGNFHVRADISSDDEIGFFSRRFNSMLEQINAYAEEMTSTNVRLQKNLRELDESRGRLQALNDASPYSVLVVERSGRIADANLTFFEMLKYGPAEYYDLSVLDIAVDGEQEAIINGCIENAIAGNKADSEATVRKKDGAPLPVMVRVRRILHGEENLLLFIMADITERKQSEEKIHQQYEQIQAHFAKLEAANRELEKAHEEVLGANRIASEEKERIDTTLRSIGEGVITTDMEGRIELMNQAAEIITGIKMSETDGSTIKDVFRIVNEKTGQPYGDPVESVIMTRGPIEFRERTVLIARDGTRKIVSPVIAPLQTTDGAIFGIVIAFRDITENVMMEDEIQKASKIESLGIFAGGIAHDFNNYLTAILGSISLVKAGLDKKDPLHEVLDEAEHISLIAKNLTRQLLTFSRGGEPIIADVQVEQLIRDTAGFVLSGSPVRAVYSIAPDIWNARVDEGQIGQVIHNLIINARQAMPEGGTVTIAAVNVTIHDGGPIPLQPGKYIRMDVSDTGPGIPENLLQKIYDPYFTTKADGSGLGLTVTYSIIKKHSGRIEVQTGHGRGTTFTVYLPASEGRVEKKIHGRTRRNYAGLSILIMDDEQFILNTASRMMSRLGFAVTEVRGGSEAVRRYREALDNGTPYDLVIMDLTIPGGMGGKEAIGILREMHPGVRAIVSSGYSNDPVMANYADYGFCGVVVKPYRLSDLEDVIASIIPPDAGKDGTPG